MSCSTSTIALTPARLGRRDQRFHDAVLVGRRYARRGLVEQNDLRIERKGGCDIQQLLLALRQRRGDGIEPMHKPEDIGDLGDARIDLGVGRTARETAIASSGATRRPPRWSPRTVSCGKNLDKLKCTRETVIGKRDRSDASDILAHEQYFARGRLQQSGEQVHQRRLAGAVGPTTDTSSPSCTAMVT